MGFLRLLLALSVLFSHIGDIPGLKLFSAETAVSSFFIISGFYISLGLNERYVGKNANQQFYFGRLFRLWPIYFVSLLLLVPTGVMRQTIHSITELPPAMAALAFFSNFAIFGVDLLSHVSAVDGRTVFSEFGIDPKHNGAQFIMNLPAWSLSIEMMFYAVAPFVARSFKRTMIFLGAGLAYCFYLKYIDPTLIQRYRADLYFPFMMAYFGLGMAAYWINRLYPLAHHGNVKCYLAFAIVAGIAIYGGPLDRLIYVELALAIPALFHLTKHSDIDRIFGDLAFPIYILHVPVGGIVRSSGLVEANAYSYFFATIVTSVAVLFLIDRPIEKLRRRFFRRRYQAADYTPGASTALA